LDKQIKEDQKLKDLEKLKKSKKSSKTNKDIILNENIDKNNENIINADEESIIGSKKQIELELVPSNSDSSHN